MPKLAITLSFGPPGYATIGSSRGSSYAIREGGQVAILTDFVLLADKTAMSHFAAQRKSFPFIRQFNHTGIILSHHVWDGAVRSACEKACRRYHRAYELHMESTCCAAEALLLTIKSWLTFCTCILHSVHNAQRWGIKNFVDDKDTIRDNWITCKSLINSQEVLWKYWEEWLL